LTINSTCLLFRCLNSAPASLFNTRLLKILQKIVEMEKKEERQEMILENPVGMKEIMSDIHELRSIQVHTRNFSNTSAR
jgi:hypothetical protein